MKRRNNKKGFTLAELLIVVAIIAVLVAVAIPVFSNSMNKAKVAVEQANARSTYAEAASQYLLDGTVIPAKTYDGITYTPTTENNGVTWTITLSESKGGGTTTYTFPIN